MSDAESAIRANGDERATSKVDWKAVIAAMALTWTVLLGAAGIFRAHVLDAIDVRIAEHRTEASDARRKFFDELERRADGSLGRIGTLEVNCARVSDWRQQAQRDIDTMRTWRESAEQRIAQCTSWITIDDRRMDALEQKIDGIKDRIRGGSPRADVEDHK